MRPNNSPSYVYFREGSVYLDFQNGRKSVPAELREENEIAAPLSIESLTFEAASWATFGLILFDRRLGMYSARDATIHHGSRGDVENPNIPRPSCIMLRIILAR